MVGQAQTRTYLHQQETDQEDRLTSIVVVGSETQLRQKVVRQSVA